jgi:hypothetical protein
MFMNGPGVHQLALVEVHAGPCGADGKRPTATASRSGERSYHGRQQTANDKRHTTSGEGNGGPND